MMPWRCSAVEPGFVDLPWQSLSPQAPAGPVPRPLLLECAVEPALFDSPWRSLSLAPASPMPPLLDQHAAVVLGGADLLEKSAICLLQLIIHFLPRFVPPGELSGLAKASPGRTYAGHFRTTSCALLRHQA